MEEEVSNQRNINEKWLDNIYEILMKLETYERLAKEGCSTIIEYIQSSMQNANFNLDMAQLQKKNLDFFITEFEVLLNNVKHMVDKNKFLKMQLKLARLISYEEEVDGFLEVRIDMIQHSETYILKPEFSYAQKLISELRGMAVSSLWSILSPKAKESLDRTPQ